MPVPLHGRFVITNIVNISSEDINAIFSSPVDSLSPADQTFVELFENETAELLADVTKHGVTRSDVTILHVCSPTCGEAWGAIVANLTVTNGTRRLETTTTTTEVIFEVRVALATVVNTVANSMSYDPIHATKQMVAHLKDGFGQVVWEKERWPIWTGSMAHRIGARIDPASLTLAALYSPSPTASPTASPTRAPTTLPLADGGAAGAAVGVVATAICAAIAVCGVLGYFARATIASAARAGAKKARALLRAADPAIALFVTFLQSAGALGALKKNALI